MHGQTLLGLKILPAKEILILNTRRVINSQNAVIFSYISFSANTYRDA